MYKAVCKRSNQVVVLKSYQLSAICELYQHQIFREVALHASLKHEHVVQLSGAFQVRLFSVTWSRGGVGGGREGGTSNVLCMQASSTSTGCSSQAHSR